MAQGLSTLARLLRKGRFSEFETGESGPRTNPMMPALEGFTRGTLGVQGSSFGIGSRNSNLQEDEDRQMIQSPIMGAFLDRMAGPHGN